MSEARSAETADAELAQLGLRIEWDRDSADSGMRMGRLVPQTPSIVADAERRAARSLQLCSGGEQSAAPRRPARFSALADALIELRRAQRTRSRSPLVVDALNRARAKVAELARWGRR